MAYIASKRKIANLSRFHDAHDGRLDLRLSVLQRKEGIRARAEFNALRREGEGMATFLRGPADLHLRARTRTSSTRCRVSAFSGSVSFCATTVPILTLTSVEVKRSLNTNASSSPMSLLIGSLRSTLRPLTHASDCSDRFSSCPGMAVACRTYKCNLGLVAKSPSASRKSGARLRGHGQ